MSDMYDLFEGRYQTNKRPLKYHYLQENQTIQMAMDGSRKVTDKKMRHSEHIMGKGLYKRRKK